MKRRTGNDQQGQSVVELALVLPFLVLLMLGLVDVSRAVQAYNIISNMSREGANLALRNASLDPQQLMNALASTSQPLQMRDKGMMYLVRVQGVTGGAPKFTATRWNVPAGAPSSKVDAAYVSQALGGKKLTDQDTIYIFEVFYEYQSLFGSYADYGIFSPQLHSVSIF